MPEPIVPQAASRQAGARDFLAVLFRRRWIIATVFAVTTLTVLAINLTQPLFYESTGKVIVKRGVKDNLIQGYTRTLTWEEELASEVETVKSGVVVQKAQDRLDEARRAAGQPVLRIDQRRVEASVLGESNVIAISYQDRKPEVAVEVTDALIAAYMDYRRNEYTLKYPAEFFNTEIARVERELNDWTMRREQFMRESGTVNLQVESQNDAGFVREQQSTLADLDQDLASKRAALQGMESYLRSESRPDDLPFLANTNMANDVVILELKKKLSDAQVKFREIQTVYVPESREYQQQKEQLDNLANMLSSEIRSRVSLAREEIRVLEAKRDEVRRSLAQGEARLSTYANREARLSEFDTRIAALKKNYEDLTESSGRAKISKATSPDWTVDLLTPAGKPYAKNQRDYVRLALAPIFSLIVGLGLAFFLDGIDSTLRSPREAEEALELPVLASLTDQKERRA